MPEESSYMNIHNNYSQHQLAHSGSSSQFVHTDRQNKKTVVMSNLTRSHHNFPKPDESIGQGSITDSLCNP